MFHLAMMSVCSQTDKMLNLAVVDMKRRKQELQFEKVNSAECLHPKYIVRNLQLKNVAITVVT